METQSSLTEATDTPEQSIFGETAMEKPTMKAPRRLSELFIPDPEFQPEAVKWRLDLVEKFKLVPVGDLRDAIAAHVNGKLGEKIKCTWQTIAMSEKLKIDSIDETILYVCKMYLFCEDLPDKMVLDLDIGVLSLISSLGKDHALSKNFQLIRQHKFYVAHLRKKFLATGLRLFTNNVMEIRSRLALMELVAMFCPEVLLPHMLNISARYLTSPQMERYVRDQQRRLLSPDRNEAKAARKNLSSIQRTIVPDQRKKRKTKYPKWVLYNHFKGMVRAISDFRQPGGGLVWQSGALDDFFLLWHIPNEYRALIKSKQPPAAELALEIMWVKKMIDSPKAFREFQPVVNKLSKKVSDDLVNMGFFVHIELVQSLPYLYRGADSWSILEMFPDESPGYL